jgi:hypothetical protein
MNMAITATGAGNRANMIDDLLSPTARFFGTTDPRGRMEPVPFGAFSAPTDLPMTSEFAVDKPLFSATMLEDMNALLIFVAGRSRIGTLADLTGLIKHIDENVNIEGLFVNSVGPFAGVFLFLRHRESKAKLEVFERNFRSAFQQTNFGSFMAGNELRFKMGVTAPDEPGQLFLVCQELRPRKINIRKLDGDVDDSPSTSADRPRCTLTFILELPAAQEASLADLAAKIESFGPNWKVDITPLDGNGKFFFHSKR